MELAVDFGNEAPTKDDIGQLIEKAESQGAWSLFVRIRKVFETDAVFDSGWYTEATEGSHVILRKAIGVRVCTDRN